MVSEKREEAIIESLCRHICFIEVSIRPIAGCIDKVRLQIHSMFEMNKVNIREILTTHYAVKYVVDVI